MDTLGWLLILGMAAILLILYDGQRRGRKARLESHRIAVTSAEPSAHLSSSSAIESPMPSTDRAKTVPAPSLPSPPSGPASLQQNRQSPALDETVHTGSFIGPSIHVMGHVEAAQPLTVAGRVEGEITLHNHALSILASGEAGPVVRAHQLEVDGRLDGAVHITDSAIFQAAGRFDGKLTAERLRCVKGATLSGQFSIG